MGNHERCDFCNWDSYTADCAVYCRIGISCDSPVNPCTVGSVSLADFERDLIIWTKKNDRCGENVFDNHCYQQNNGGQRLWRIFKQVKKYGTIFGNDICRFSDFVCDYRSNINLYNFK